ncbi:hypothetical protein GJ744_011748 [Endocarpon pusillum]|uniref:Integral membrane protein n=1 Tax=Endocarpon pusillum TaxID=364733 RepID=A0A8H7ACT4_9EURO|nr:hypothetical protein GJ744_011748 [Endocarpon pusillum]
MISSDTPNPSPFAYVLSFLIVGLCWGFTTPFIRRAALTYTTPTHPSITDPDRSWLTRQLAKAFFTILGLLKSPGYAIPLLCNLTGSVWFFLLVGKAELSLTVPITNSLAFLFTVLGDWYVDGKIISKDTWLGMGLVCGGIGLCVLSKR